MNPIWKNLKESTTNTEAEKERIINDFVRHMDSVPLDHFRKLVAKELDGKMKPSAFLNISYVLNEFAYEEARKFNVWGGNWNFVPTAGVIIKELAEVFYVTQVHNFEYEVSL